MFGATRWLGGLLCPLSWHMNCLPPAARVLAQQALADEEDWQCPVCLRMPRPVGFVGNSQRAPPGRGGGQQRKRFRSATEGLPAQRKAAKKAGRTRELRHR